MALDVLPAVKLDKHDSGKVANGLMCASLGGTQARGLHLKTLRGGRKLFPHSAPVTPVSVNSRAFHRGAWLRYAKNDAGCGGTLPCRRGINLTDNRARGSAVW